jgi:phage-related protein
MAKTSIGKAYVQIVPSAVGITDAISKEIDGDAVGKKTGSSMASGIASVLGKSGAAIAAGFGAAMAGVGAVAKEAFSSFADYQQLTGGIETLFGAGGQSMMDMVTAAKEAGESTQGIVDKYMELKEAQDLVMGNAANAWKTAGLNVNEYMETVSGFAASLKQSTSSNIEAAKAADVAVQDMADNSAKMGTSMESIMAAYAGFSKGQYQLLDNLKIGYGGTKTEMERLLADAEKLTGQKYDINNLANVYDAIHAIQTEMGITGTTAKEALFTISGSAAATKSAWENVLTAIGGGGDLKEAMFGLQKAIFGGENGGGLLANVLPQIQTAIEGIGDFIGAAAPIISEQIPVLVDSLIPVLVDSASALLNSVLDALPGLLDSLGSVGETVINKITELLPRLLQTGIDLIVMLASGITQAIPRLLPTLVSLVLDIGNMLVSNAPKLLTAALELVKVLAENLAANAVNLATGAIALISQLEVFIIENLPMIIQTAVEIVLALVEGLTSPEAIDQLIGAYVLLVTSLVDAVTDNLGEILETGLVMIGALAKGLMEALPELLMIVPRIYKSLFDKLTSMDWASIGKNMLLGIKNGLLKAKDTLLKAIKDLCTECWASVKSFFGIASPSKLMTYAGTMIGEGLAIGIEGQQKTVTDAMAGLNTAIYGGVGSEQLAYAGAYGGGSITNNITVNGAEDPELWTQGFIRTLKREGRMING